MPFAAMLCCASVQALPLAGWDGSVDGCAGTFYWYIGSFRLAKDLPDACTQAGEDHAHRPGSPGKLPYTGSKGSLEDAFHARCYYQLGPDPKTCGVVSAFPKCPAGSSYVDEAKACFCGRTSRESNGGCIPGVDCDEMVRRLKQLQVAPTDPRFGFYRNQTCIAEKSCSARAGMEDNAWLNRVVPAFVSPLLSKDGAWIRVMDECKALVRVGQGLRCQARMATYHIEVDLQNALIKQGCGTQSDWNKVGEIITGCVRNGAKEDVSANGLRALAGMFADDAVQTARDAVRTQCLASHIGKGS